MGNTIEAIHLKEETKPLISAIVPIYNVERYIRKCLDITIIENGVTIKNFFTADSKYADFYVVDQWKEIKL